MKRSSPLRSSRAGMNASISSLLRLTKSVRHAPLDRTHRTGPPQSTIARRDDLEHQPPPEIRCTIPVSKARYQKLSAPAQKALVQGHQSHRRTVSLPSRRSRASERELEKVIKLVSLFREPFILHNDHVFEALHVEQLSAALPPAERDAFGFDARGSRLVGATGLTYTFQLCASGVILSSKVGRSGVAARGRKVAVGGRSATASAAGAASSISSNDDLTPNQSGDSPHRFRRIYRRAHRIRTFSTDYSQPLNLLVRARDQQEAQRASCGARCSCTWIFRASKNFLNSKINDFSRADLTDSHFGLSMTTITASSFAPRIL